MQKWKGREVGIRSGGNGFYEPYGFRKYPGGVFSRKAVADLFGQAMNGERKVFARLRTRFFYFLVETRVGHRVSMGNFVSCGTRLRALP